MSAFENRQDAVKNYDYFISFAMEDIDAVKPLVEIMENTYNAKCWFQLKDSKAEFVEAIMDGIEQSRAFIIFVSPSSAKSFYALSELEYALGVKQRNEEYEILPVVLDNDDPELEGKVYRKIKFYISRLNMVFYTKNMSRDAMVLRIFDQTGFNIIDEAVRSSMYHSSDGETQRLKAQNEIMTEFSKECFGRAAGNEPVVLDIGCAAGDHIMMQLEGVEYKSLLGVDVDQKQIEQANDTYGSDKNTFCACDILSDEFDDLLSDYLDDHDERAFDLITVSAVLLHVSDPVRLLKTLRRFLKKGGYLLIQDEDDGANVVYPESRFFDIAFSIWEDSKESGDRHCARKIPSYLQKAGYKAVSLEKCGISSAGMDESRREALWDIYFNYHLWLAAEENMFYHVASANKMLAEYKEMYEEHKASYDKGEIFIQLGFYLFIAQK